MSDETPAESPAVPPEKLVKVYLKMKAAKSALEAGDAEGAKRNMGLAERQIEKLEDFLGR